MSNYDDVTNKMGDLEYAINDLGSTTLDDVADRISEISGIFDSLEREVNYLDDDFRELEEYRELGDITEVQEMCEKAEAKDPDELANLKEAHENQRLVIHALLTKLREVQGAVTEDEIMRVITTAGKV
jgi:Xaa-Pro aminopeptidase